MNNTASHSILVVGPAWVGDMVMAQSLFITLRQQHPEALIDVLAPAWSEPLLARMPQVHSAVLLPTGHGQLGLGARFRLGRQLRERHYQQAIVIPRSYKAALVPFFAGIPRRTGYRGEMRYGVINDIHPLDKSLLTQTVQRQVGLAYDVTADLPPAIPPPALQVDQTNQQQLLALLNLQQDKPAIGMMPGAEYGPAKQWPVENYAALARQLTAAGYQVWIFGSAKEQALGDSIVQSAGQHVHNLCGRTALVDTVDLLALCDAAVTNDSGLMHVACAVDTKVIAIYGSSTPDYTPPLSAKARVIYQRLSCSPCFKRVCPYGHTQCLTDISVTDVFNQVITEG